MEGTEVTLVTVVTLGAAIHLNCQAVTSDMKSSDYRHQGSCACVHSIQKHRDLKGSTDRFHFWSGILGVQKVSPREQFYFASILNSVSEARRILIERSVRVPYV